MFPALQHGTNVLSQDVYVFERVLQSGVAGPGDLVAFFIHWSNKGLPQVQLFGRYTVLERDA